jgi:hypothetical protein
MGIFRSLFGYREPNPEWAATLNREGYLRFLAILRRRLDREARPYEINVEVGSFHFQDEPNKQFGLWNLAQICRKNGGRDWVEIIDEHVTRVMSTKHSDSEFAEKFDDAKHLLLPRLIPLDQPVEGSATIDVCSAFHVVVCVDLQESILGVTLELAEKWERTPDELYSVALDNLWKMPRFDPAEFKHSEGHTYIVCDDASFYVASQALQLNRYLFPEPEWGALLAIPNRHSFLYEPIDGPISPLTVQRLIGLAHSGYVNGPGSITPSLLWYRDGNIIALNVDENARIVGPEEAKDSPLISY